MWELLSFIQGRSRRKCLESLAGGPKTPSTIAKALDTHLSHISRAIRELQEKGLVECMTPELNKNRIYRITDRGKQLLNEIHRSDQ